ncbi:MAG: 50S ribosomal protein L29 [archaeon]
MAVKLNVKDMRGMAAEELSEKIIGIKADLAKEKALISSGTRSENPGKIKKMRKTIARILTIINEKEKTKGEVKEEK